MSLLSILLVCGFLIWWLPAMLLLFDRRLPERLVWRWVALLALTSWPGLLWYQVRQRRRSPR